MTEKDLICIVCPVGCRLCVVKDESAYKISGNNCSRGIDYANHELTNPTRTLPTTVQISNASLKRLPVRTVSPIPKSKIMDCMKLLKAVRVSAPVDMGDVIIYDILGTGVDVIATRSMNLVPVKYGDITITDEIRHCSI